MQVEDKEETLSNERERSKGDVACCVCLSRECVSGGRLLLDLFLSGSSMIGLGMSGFCFDLNDFGGSASKGAASRRLGSPTSKLPCLLSKRKPGFKGLLGGVASSSSRALSSGITLAVSETSVLGAGVFAPVDTPDDSAPSRSLRRLTTRFFRLRMGCVRDLLAPRLRPADAE